MTRIDPPHSLDSFKDLTAAAVARSVSSKSDFFHARFGGVDWSSDVALHAFDQMSLRAPNPIHVLRMGQAPSWRPARVVGQASVGNDRVRFDWNDEAIFEIVPPSFIGWYPLHAWSGRLPTAFGSTVTAILMAMRGLLPFHASSVVLHDRAWMILGSSGAGKSTLAAELTSRGALVLADDLTIVKPASEPLAFRGRPTMRLHVGASRALELIGHPEPTQDGRAKVMVRPKARAPDQAWPVGGVLLLDGNFPQRLSAVGAVVALGSHLFRPRILSALPNGAALRGSLFEMAKSVAIEALPTLSSFEPDARADRISDALRAIDRLCAAAQ